MEDQIISILNTVTPLVAILVGTGLAVKYAPWLKWFPNEGIRLLNALIVFFGALGGLAPPPAQAGIFGDIAQQFGLFGKVGASFVVSGVASWFFERHLRDPLAKLGIKKPT
jgi:hypothetical protein